MQVCWWCSAFFQHLTHRSKFIWKNGSGVFWMLYSWNKGIRSMKKWSFSGLYLFDNCIITWPFHILGTLSEVVAAVLWVIYLLSGAKTDEQLWFLLVLTSHERKQTNKNPKTKNLRTNYSKECKCQFKWLLLCILTVCFLLSAWISYSQQWPEAELERSRASAVFHMYSAESSTGQNCKPSYSLPPQSSALPMNRQPHLGCFSQWDNIAIM